MKQKLIELIGDAEEILEHLSDLESIMDIEDDAEGLSVIFYNMKAELKK